MDFYELDPHPPSTASSTLPESTYYTSAVALVRKQDDAITLDQSPKELAHAANAKKPLSFHMSFLALNLMVLLVSLDATALAVAIPVQLAHSHGRNSD